VTAVRSRATPAGDPFGVVGQVLANRFRIESGIAEGGFGVVYRAQQLALDRAVAIKVLKTPDDLSPLARMALQRIFETEARTAARLKHPHIVEVYDFGVAETAGRAPLLWMAMEWLEGKTLEQVLADREGRPMSPAEALDFLGPLLRTMGFAHRQRVAHRDLKPGNIMLAQEGGTAILKVLDFGIAKMMAGTGPGAPGSGTHNTQDAPAFSPDYAAPEQLVRAATGPWTDVHALALIVTEFLTGQTPYGPTDGDLYSQVLSPRRPTPESKGVPVGDWEPVLNKALAQRPQDRYPDADAFVEALEKSLISPPSNRKRRRRGLSALAALGGLGALAVAGVLTVEAGEPGRRVEMGAQKSAAPVRLRRSVAVFGFQDRGAPGSETWLSTALAQVFSANLGSTADLRPVASERIVQARRELRIDRLDVGAAGLVSKIRANLRCDLILLGAFRQSAAGAIELEVVLKDGATGDTIANFTERGSTLDLYDLATRSGAKLRVALGLAPASADQQQAARSVLPVSPQAARLYAEGLDQLHRFRFVEAKALLRRSVEVEPAFPLAHAALARALDSTGAETAAQPEARRALELSGSLPREEQLAIKAQYHFTWKEYDQAIATYAALHAFFPDNLDYGIRLTQTEMYAGRLQDALRTVATLRALPATISDDPRIDFEEARVLHGLSRYKECLAVSERAMATGRERNNWSLVARTGFFCGISLQELGRTAEGLTALEDASDLAREFHDLGTAGIIVTPLARAYVARGELGRARRELEEAERSLTRMGSLYYAASTSESLARFDLEDGDLPRAHARLVGSIARYRAEGSLHALSTGLAELGRLSALRSDFPAADQAVDEALAASEKLQRKNAIVGALLTKAFIARKRAALGDEAEHEKRALALTTNMSSPSWRARVLVAQSDRLRLAGDLAGARAALDQATTLEKPLGDVYQGAASALVGLALAIAEGRAPEAAAEARTYVVKLDQMGARTLALEALALEVEALWRAGRADEAVARSQGALARRLLAGQLSREALLSAETSFATARAQRGAREGEAALERVVVEARTAGFLDRAFIAQLALVEARRRRAPGLDATDLLAEARQHGFAAR
jgi:hypothetical protein